MNTVKINYRPYPFLKYQREITINCPDSFSDITPVQLMAIARLLQGLISERKFLSIILGIPKNILRLMSPFDLFKLSELTQPFFEAKPYHVFFIESIAGGSLLCPKPKLKNITFAQFIFADTYYANYIESNKSDDLIKFIAALYLPKSVMFRENLIDENSPVVKNVDTTTLQAVAINYQLIREWMALAYPLVFSSHETKKTNSGPAQSSDWISVFDALVADDIVNQDKYADLPVHNVFRYMTSRIKDNIRQKSKRK